MMSTQGETQVAQFLKLLHQFKSSSVRIDVGPLTTLLRRWKFVMGHANRFWQKNWTCTVSQPNLCPGSWQLTRSSSASTSTLNFFSSPPTMIFVVQGRHWWWELGLLLWPWDKATIIPGHKGQKIQSGVKAMSSAWSSLSLTSMWVCKIICPNRPNCEFRVLLRNFAATAWKRAKTAQRTLARTDLDAAPLQRPFSHFHIHPAVSGEI
jgi:hypothetical protein